MKFGARLLNSFISLSLTAELSKTTLSSSSVYGSHAIMVNLDKSASDNFISSPVLHVAITLKFLLKFLNSLFSFVVKVPGISSTKVKLCFPENNSLNLSNTIVLTCGISFSMRDFLLSIADNINPGLNSISILIRLFSFVFSWENNFFFKFETATKNEESG